jgi:hypothetical protein
MYLISEVRSIFNPSAQGLLIFEYIGSPPYKHLTMEVLEARIKQVFFSFSSLWIAAIILLTCSIYQKNIYLIIGFVANIPWLAFNICAVNNNIAALYTYYSFPLMIVLAWPILSTLIQYGPSPPKKRVKQAIFLQALILVSGLFSWKPWENKFVFEPSYAARWGSWTLQEGVLHSDKANEFIDTLQTQSKIIGPIAVSYSVGSLITDWETQKLLMSAEQYILDKKPIRINTFIKFSKDIGLVSTDEFNKIISKNNLVNYYYVPNTTIRLFTSLTPRQLGKLYPLMTQHYRLFIPGKKP